MIHQQKQFKPIRVPCRTRSSLRLKVLPQRKPQSHIPYRTWSSHATNAHKTPNMLKTNPPTDKKKKKAATRSSRPFHQALVKHQQKQFKQIGIPYRTQSSLQLKVLQQRKPQSHVPYRTRSSHATSAHKTLNMLKTKRPTDEKKKKVASTSSQSFHQALVNMTHQQKQFKQVGVRYRTRSSLQLKVLQQRNPQSHVPYRTRSSHATSAHKTPNMQKTKPPIDEKKKKAATWSSRSFHDTHKHMQKNKEKENNIKMVGQSSNCFCGICFDFKPQSDMFRRNMCSHPFCADCISKYVAAQIQKNVLKVNCPNPNCYVELKPEYLQPILPRQVIIRWESARHESSIAQWEKIYCPFKNCSVLLVNEGDGGKVVTSSECPSCHRLFCAQCKVPWHAGIDCKEFQKLKKSEDEKYLDNKFLELAKTQMWQRCPKCSLYVERLCGCEHMTCRCGCNFCYICGEDWEFGHLCHSRPST